MSHVEPSMEEKLLKVDADLEQDGERLRALHLLRAEDSLRREIANIIMQVVSTGEGSVLCHTAFDASDAIMAAIRAEPTDTAEWLLKKNAELAEEVEQIRAACKAQIEAADELSRAAMSAIANVVIENAALHRQFEAMRAELENLRKAEETWAQKADNARAYSDSLIEIKNKLHRQLEKARARFNASAQDGVKAEAERDTLHRQLAEARKAASKCCDGYEGQLQMLTVINRDLNRQIAEMREGQPIETAPQDGTQVLVWAPGRDGLPSLFSLCSWHPDAGFCIDDIREPTHWWPLPDKPASA